ncbi:MAG: glutathione S-transferase [Rhodobacteraceae bacterium]|nr:glutathione S-transferase [Paracoccaceae bacterium]
MKLYHAAASPFVRKVMVLLHETGNLDRVEIVNTVLTPVAPAANLTGKNPLSKIPALERASGATLYDSRVITAYLDDLFDAGLYPTGSRRWETLTLEATADGIMDAGVSMIYDIRLRPEDKQWPDWGEAQWSKIVRTVGALDAQWMSHLSGPLDMGQIAIGCALGYLDFRHDARGWRDHAPALAEWFAAFGERPSMQATRPA